VYECVPTGTGFYCSDSTLRALQQERDEKPEDGGDIDAELLTHRSQHPWVYPPFASEAIFRSARSFCWIVSRYTITVTEH